MGEMYVMRRANGDLLTVEVRGKRRIPVWTSEDSVTRYKAFNPELIFYWPVKLNRDVVKRVAGKASNEPAEFFLLSPKTPDAQFEDGKPVTLEDVLPEAPAASNSAPSNN
ncbi:MAG TPA: hypothetical protein VFV34_03950 [Blastocatellia bacterium]|nr:hypothetical protein [Blastocatellia bacterium]